MWAQGASTSPGVSVSGYVQPRYDIYSSDGETTDRVFLRRAVVSFGADLAKSWRAVLQIDVGPVASSEGGRLIVKDAFVQYTGWEARGITVGVGNQKTPFSQATLQSASRRSLVERPVTGDSGLGVPGRAIAVRADGWHANHTVHWMTALSAVHIALNPERIDTDGISEADDGSSEGPAVTGRLEFHPLGEVPRSQGDLERGPLRIVVGGAAYRWTNDDDVTAEDEAVVDAESVRGVELSAGLRGAGLSIDGAVQRISARVVDPSAIVGLYRAGRAGLDKATAEAGYMLVRHRIEVVGAFEAIDSDAFDSVWQRAAVGMNWYVKGHALKFSVMHRESFDERGVRGLRSRATYLQSHFAF